MLKLVVFLLKSAFYSAFSQMPYICSVFYVFPSDCEKIVKKKKSLFELDFTIFSHCQEVLYVLLMYFQPKRRKYFLIDALDSCY